MAASYRSKDGARQRALAAAGISQEEAPRYELHHVVEQTRKIAEPARLNLAAVGVGLHDPANLMLLLKPHQAIHTSAYTQAIIKLTSAARPFGYSTMVSTLENVKRLLRKNGSFP